MFEPTEQGKVSGEIKMKNNVMKIRKITRAKFLVIYNLFTALNALHCLILTKYISPTHQL